MVQLDLMCCTDSNERKNLIILAIFTRLISKEDIEHYQTHISNLEKKLKKSDLKILQGFHTKLGGFGEYPFCRCFKCDEDRDFFNECLRTGKIILKAEKSVSKHARPRKEAVLLSILASS